MPISIKNKQMALMEIRVFISRYILAYVVHRRCASFSASSVSPDNVWPDGSWNWESTEAALLAITHQLLICNDFVDYCMPCDR